MPVTWLFDLRDALRSLVRSPLPSIAAIVIIAFGIGVNATVYSIADGFVRRPAPGVPAERRLVLLEHRTKGQADPATSYPNYRDYAAQATTLRELTARGAGIERVTLTMEDGRATPDLRGALVTPSYFRMVGLPFAKGRPFTDDEGERSASGLVAIVSYRVWREQLDGVDDLGSRRLRLNGRPVTIVGVLPPRFQGLTIVDRLDVWLPLVAYARLTGHEAELQSRAPGQSNYAVGVYGELAPGVTLAQAQSELATISQRLQAAYPKEDGQTTAVVQPCTAGAGPNRQQLTIVFTVLKIMVFLVLLVVCANVANIMALRGVLMEREVAMRTALGASRVRIVRLLLAQGLVLSLCALAGALLLAQWASAAVLRLIPHASGDMIDVGPDLRILLDGAVLAVVSTLIFMALPVLRVLRGDLLTPLKASAAGAVRGRSRVSWALAAGQLALAFALLTNLGLVRASMAAAGAFGAGREYDNLLVVRIDTERAAASPQQHTVVIDALYNRLRAIPGVDLVSYSQQSPVNGDEIPAVRLNGAEPPARIAGNIIGPGYFGALRVRPIAGRDLSPDDRVAGKPTAVINAHLARTLWPGEQALGRTLTVGADAVEIVGVVADGVVPGFSLHDDWNLLFLPERQHPFEPHGVMFYVRAGDLNRVVPAIRLAVRDTDARLTLNGIQPMTAQIEGAVSFSPVIGNLLLVFAILAGVIAAVGLFSIVAYYMSSHARERGVRVALGLTPGGMIRGEMRKAIVLIVVSTVVGGALSVAVSGLLRGLVVGMHRADAAAVSVYIGTFALLAAVALVAHYLPARRAALADPMRVLRID
jgi:putative ABC transport system permease protein